MQGPRLGEGLDGAREERRAGEEDQAAHAAARGSQLSKELGALCRGTFKRMALVADEHAEAPLVAPQLLCAVVRRNDDVAGRWRAVHQVQLLIHILQQTTRVS